MRILIFNWQDITNPLAGGAEVHLHEVFSRIARLGNEVTLYCSSFPGAAPEEELNGVHVVREGGRSFFNLFVPRAYRGRFCTERFDIVIDDMNKIPFFTPLYVSEPLYAITHHLFDTSIYRETNAAVATYVYGMESAAVALYRRRRIPFIVGSPSTYRELLEHRFRSEDVALINYAVNHGVYRRTGVAHSSTPLAAYVGRLKRYKSIDHILLALAKAREKVPDLRLMVIGEGDDRGRLEAMAVSLGLRECVEFTGFVSEEKKVDLMQRTWFNVTSSSKEGWGLTVIEANACGTPVIASDVPGLRDAVKDGETGLLYRYGDIESLSRRIIQLVEEASLRESLSRNALQWAGTFNWDTAASQTIGLLEKRAGVR